MSASKTSRPRNSGPKGRLGSYAVLRARLGKVRARALPQGREDRARRILDAWLATAEAQGQPLADTLDTLATGQAAVALAAITGEQIRATNPPELANAACASGCAFCCILLEGDGGLITEAEARRLHRALAPLAGRPDGRAWNAHACAALDPATRQCRAYDARPTVCRSFLSTSVAACEVNALGGEADGSGMLGNHLDYLAVLALSRELMRGSALLGTYALDALARATVEGQDEKAALAAARHPSRELDDTCHDIFG